MIEFLVCVRATTFQSLRIHRFHFVKQFAVQTLFESNGLGIQREFWKRKQKKNPKTMTEAKHKESTDSLLHVWLTFNHSSKSQFHYFDSRKTHDMQKQSKHWWLLPVCNNLLQFIFGCWLNLPFKDSDRKLVVYKVEMIITFEKGKPITWQHLNTARRTIQLNCMRGRSNGQNSEMMSSRQINISHLDDSIRLRNASANITSGIGHLFL